MFFINGLAIDDFTQAYIECALWSSHDEENEGDYLDKRYSIKDIDLDSLKTIIEECRDFQQSWAMTLNKYCQLVQNEEYSGMELAGHDYWLTRNGHGAGFWDRGAGSIGELLTAVCRWQSRYLYTENGIVFYCNG